ncbi:alanine--tRNA ligase-related protein [Halobaculum sp. D14]|uniref:alanine--tRNA ligase-related protein n=1 Tax=Halobaculum sp. D14 TaxID=3421642 RepID=UPI003EBF18C3
MSESLAPDNPGVREFEATVESVDGTDVVLSETYFYPEGGGQPADRGTLGDELVVDVQPTDGGVVHTLAEPPAFDAGDDVVGVVDDDFRTYCMRAHTASHVLYGAARRVLDDLGYGGFGISAAPTGRRDSDGADADIDADTDDGTGADSGGTAGDEKVRVDFTTTTDVDDNVFVELERLVNRAVWDARDVTWEELPVEEARGRDDVAFNTKTEEGVMSDADTVRVVSVDGWDWAACGGTHVSNTAEIGPVTLLDRSNPGEGMTGVEFAVGPAGIGRRAAVHGAALDAARELGVAVDDVPAEAARLRAERDDLADELGALREEVLAARLADCDAVDRDGLTWRVGVVDGFDANQVGDAAQRRVDDSADDVVAAVGGDDAPFVVVATDGDVDAGDVVDGLTDEFGGGGGGGPTFAQGGGLDADPSDVVAALRR